MPSPLHRQPVPCAPAPQVTFAATGTARRAAVSIRLRLLGLAVGACSALVADPARAADDSTFEAVQKSAAEWVRLRAETARLDGQWAAEKGLLESTVKGLEERATRLEEDRELLRAKTARERDELAGIADKVTRGEEQRRATEARLQTLTHELTALRPHLPPRLSSALELSFRSLAESPQGAGERMQRCLTVLNRCVQFNRVITSGEEALVVEAGGPARSLETIYWGLSRWYALDRTGRKAWLGAPGPDGWRWQPCPEALPQIARLIAIHHDQADPDFVPVPASLRTVTPVAAAQ